MENICRLCCSERFVNNYIFDEENALHLKMSLYLPIKILKDDLLPKKICDKCSCKVNDFYQFCNESIEAQNKLKLALPKSLSVSSVSQVSSLKTSSDLALKTSKCEFVDKCTQTDSFVKENTPPQSSELTVPPVKVKEEPTEVVKQEEVDIDTYDAVDYESDSSENISLINLKYSKDENDRTKTNCQIKNIENTAPRRKHSSLRKTEYGTKKSHKRKNTLENNLDNLAPFMNAIPKGTSIAVVQDKMSQQLKIEMKEEVQEVEPNDLGVELRAKYKLSKKIKKEDQMLFACCVCYMESYSRKEMLTHYRTHADVSQLRGSPPPAPPLPARPPAPPAPAPAAAPAPRGKDAPAADLATCPRCNKAVGAGAWAAHWRRHWELDRRPYRCARCHATFRDHNAIFKHGLRCRVKKQPASDDCAVRYVCDLCPEQFDYLKCLKAHRHLAHPAELRPLRLACAVCGRAFLHLNSLRRHVRAHSGRRDYLCNVCGKGLSSAEHLKSHIQIHENVKPNVCKTCGKAFVKKTNLTMHERVHSGEKPYVCEHCGKCFSQRSTLVIHERYHSGARPYVCKLCGRGFVARGLLSMHLKVACI